MQPVTTCSVSSQVLITTVVVVGVQLYVRAHFIWALTAIMHHEDNVY